MSRLSPPKVLLAATFTALTLANPAYAQSREEVRKSCRSDVIRYCRSAVGNQQKMLACMRDNRNSLSAGCRAALVAMQEKQKEQKSE